MYAYFKKYGHEKTMCMPGEDEGNGCGGAVADQLTVRVKVTTDPLHACISTLTHLHVHQHA